MRLTVLVPDTSAWIDGADAGQPRWMETCRRLQASLAVRAPHLLASELGNIVHRKHPATFGTTAAQRGGVLELLLHGVELVPGDATSRARCGGLASKHRLTFYDAEFLELAGRGDEALLLTHDAELLRAGKRELGADRAFTLDEAEEALDAGSL